MKGIRENNCKVKIKKCVLWGKPALSMSEYSALKYIKFM
jgi:hypothetical protein